MALVKILDFCNALGVKEGTVRSKLSRGQLICNENRLIDTENPNNYIYLLEINGGNQDIFKDYDRRFISNTNVDKKKSYTTKKQTKVNISNKSVKKVIKPVEITEKLENEKVNNDKGLVNIAPAVETKKIEVEKKPKLTIEERRIINEERKQRESLLAFELRKREAELLVIERRAELAKYELEKKAGNTLPLDQIVTLMAINYKSIFKSFHSQLKNIAFITVQNLGGSKEDLNSIMIELEKHLNHIVNLSKEKAQVEVDRLIQEYSEVRSRGERK